MADLPSYANIIPPVGNTNFQLVELRTRVECRGDPTDSGANCRVVADPAGAGVVLHYADLELAEAWSSWLAQLDGGLSEGYVAQLQQRGSSAGAIAHFRSICGQSPAQSLRDGNVRYLAAQMFGALANYYNALNVPWSSDPLARDLYRKWLAGPPGSLGPPDAPNPPRETDEFSQRIDYGPDWFTGSDRKGNPRYPLINRNDAVTGPVGIIPTKLIAAFRAKNPAAAAMDALEFRQIAGLQLVVAPTGGGGNVRGWPTSSNQPDNDPVFAQYIMNWAFIDITPSEARPPYEPGFGGVASASGPGYGVASIQIETAQSAPWWQIPLGTIFNCVADGELRVASGLNPDLNVCSGAHFTDATDRRNADLDQRVWSSYVWAMPLAVPTGLAAAAPLTLYLGWAKEWIRAIRQRSVKQVIIDSRKYAVFVNTIWAAQYGGATGLFEASQGNLVDALAQQHTADPMTTSIAGTVVALGAALATATYGISAVIGAVVGSGLLMYDAMRTHATHGLFKDDIGQWKPAFLRGWLDGKIAGINSASNMRPQHLPVALPPGFARAAAGVSAAPVADPADALQKMGIGCATWVRMPDTISSMPATETRDPRTFNPRNTRILSASALRIRDASGQLATMSVDQADTLRLAINAYCAGTAPVLPRGKAELAATVNQLTRVGQPPPPPPPPPPPQGLTPDQITQIVGQNGELCGEWGTLPLADKSARLLAVGYSGNADVAIAILNNRCAAVASEQPPTHSRTQASELATQPARASVLPWVLGGAAVIAGGTVIYFAVRKKPPAHGA